MTELSTTSASVKIISSLLAFGGFNGLIITDRRAETIIYYSARRQLRWIRLSVPHN